MTEEDFRELQERGRERLEQLGRFRDPVERLIARASRNRWFERVQLSESWDHEVLRVRSLDEAKRMAKDYSPVTNAVLMALESVGKAAGRWEKIRAADIYCSAYLNLYPEGVSIASKLRMRSLYMHVFTDFHGALRETILDDLVQIRFYREAIVWYERGHWRCAIGSDGRQVVW